MSILICVCVSTEKEDRAKNIHQANVVPSGISGDMHCGSGKKQVSMLPYEKVKEYFEAKNEPVCYGRFGENLVVEGLDWSEIQVGDKFRCEDVLLEVTQIGSSMPEMKGASNETVCAPMKQWFVFCKVKHVGILTEGEQFIKC